MKRLLLLLILFSPTIQAQELGQEVDVQCNYNGQDDVLINEAIQNYNKVNVYGRIYNGTPYCSLSAPITGRKHVIVDFNGSQVKASGNHSVLVMKMGFTARNGVLYVGHLSNYCSIALTFKGDFNGSYPTNIENMTIIGNPNDKKGVGIGIIGDSLSDTRRISYTFFRSVGVHNFETGILFHDLTPESNLDYVNGIYFQGRVQGSLYAIRLIHSNGNKLIFDFQPSPDTISVLIIENSSHNYIQGMFWDSQLVSNKVIILDSDSTKNHIETSLSEYYISDQGTENIIH